MFDKLRFKACIVASGMSPEEIASKLGISIATFYRKIRRDGDFSRKEIGVLTKILALENPSDIFFAEQLTKTQEEENQNERNSNF